MRPAKFEKPRIIAAAARLVAETGPSGASIARIARATGAPSGSIYHRFASRDVLLGEVWLSAAESFQSAFIACATASRDDADHDTLACFVPRRTRHHPDEARVLLLYRRDEFLDSKWPADMQARAAQLGKALSEAETGLCRALCSRDDAEALAILRHGLAAGPIAAVRPHIERRQPPPPYVDVLLRATFAATLAVLRGKA